MMIIIFSSCFALVFSLYSGIMQWVKKKMKVERFKPLDCELCMSWWVCLIWAACAGYGFLSIGMASCSAVLALLIRSQIKPAGY